HGALAAIGGPAEVEPVAPKEPAVPVKRSIAPDHLVCLEDGRKFKSLKRHLRTKYDMSPEEYRAKWNLPKDYPMVAPNYAKARSELAKSMGLGQGGRKPPRGGK
ncbi:MucR family transcriptional regulator, partial [Phenylobacterium sp.]|uniref:MucR family transcriptional regulator n=1 Tax=Phenylobacterium sp. TaxID=1871053 RepID=UPI00286E3183